MLGNEFAHAYILYSIVSYIDDRLPTLTITVEPPNKGHFGSGAFVLYSEVVLWWEVQINLLFLATSST